MHSARTGCFCVPRDAMLVFSFWLSGLEGCMAIGVENYFLKFSTHNSGNVIYSFNLKSPAASDWNMQNVNFTSRRGAL